MNLTQHAPAPMHSPRELMHAKAFRICTMQQTTFYEEYTALVESTPIEREASLIKLNPVMHESLLLVGGRFADSDDRIILFEEKHPIILDKTSNISPLITLNVHGSSGHAGHEGTLRILRIH